MSIHVQKHEAFGDSSTVYTAMTPPSTIADDEPQHDNSDHNSTIHSSVPWPGQTFIISSATTGHVLKYLGGSVVLESPGGGGGHHWICEERRGWLGFRNTSSGKLLGYEPPLGGRLICVAKRQNEFENFVVRQTPEGGYVMLMTYWDQLRAVTVEDYAGMKGVKKNMNATAGADGTVWRFTRT